ncbi:hypothetical protein [Wenyingzhuangia aestuarii]|uniref:hypothetical protein n=1 Tax=Wenyingzhuangia aestuarii TaxID=1647582 RepID=UPI00143A6027|nr:hypothetical protein [Wenyingzhuangia aestuarii]NJB84166.1 hypothetical protein [Wenyingzhuangia aestuarii]
MKKILILAIILIVSTLFSNTKQEKANKLTEKKVFYEIIPLLVNTLLDNEINSIPPPPPSVEYLNNNNFFEKTDSENLDKAIHNWKKSKEYKKTLLDWKKNIISSKPDRYKGYLVLENIVYLSTDSLNIISFFGEKLNLKKRKTIDKFKIDLEKIQLTEIKIKLKLNSELPKKSEILNNYSENKIKRIMRFSNFMIDSTEKYSVIDIGYSEGRIGGYGVRFYMKKINNQWNIEKKENLWIS